jgi:hypothetical protein
VVETSEVTAEHVATVRLAEAEGWRVYGGDATVTERVYRHQLKPVIAEAATTMNMIFQLEGQQAARKSA